jgi:hypothetical protein
MLPDNKLPQDTCIHSLLSNFPGMFIFPPGLGAALSTLRRMGQQR